MDVLSVEGATTLGTAVAACWAGIESFRSRRRATSAEGHASRAVELSKPTGNGFAGNTTRTLEEIRGLIVEFKEEHKADIGRVEGKIDRHVEDHAAEISGRTHRGA